MHLVPPSESRRETSNEPHIGRYSVSGFLDDDELLAEKCMKGDKSW